MNRHQVLTGTANSGEHCCTVGSVEGVNFTVYAAGCDIVILASDFQRVQIIPGATHGNIQVGCIDVSTDSGKIAASYDDHVFIFEPAPLLHHDSSHKLDYQWFQTGSFKTDSYVTSLSWNLEGTRLLASGELIEMWHCSIDEPGHEQDEGDQDSGHVSFSVGAPPSPTVNVSFQLGETSYEQQDETWSATWERIWSCRTATPVFHLQFSPDGLLFASAGKNDRFVKIWYENKKLSFPIGRKNGASPCKREINYSFLYIAHPRTVTGFQWRKTSKYMPRGSVSNMLVTACKDNICRIWCETFLPDDGLMEMSQLDANFVSNAKHKTHRHKHKFMQRLNHIRHSVHIRKRHKSEALKGETILPLPSLMSAHDFHKYTGSNGVLLEGLTPRFHFHLAASINPETDIPLIPSIANTDLTNNFVIHWLDNKELHFTMEAEKILEEMNNKVSQLETERFSPHLINGHHGDKHHTTEDEEHPDEHHKHKKSLRRRLSMKFKISRHHHGGSEHHHGGSETSEHDTGDASHHTSDDEHHDNDDSDRQKRKLKRKFSFRRMSRKSNAGFRDSDLTEVSSTASLASSHGSSAQLQDHHTDSIKVTANEALDRKIEGLLRDWHQNPDMLFSIHPVDGSFLVWLVDWLDEPYPGSIRQAQISFSSRIPHAFPVPDAMSMSSKIPLYCNTSKLDIKTAMKTTEFKHKHSASTGSFVNKETFVVPTVSMLSKHKDGSVNLWTVNFLDHSKFQTVVSVSHSGRACGHRFRTNDAACHPVLPLLLTTSHHNLPDHQSTQHKAWEPLGFCSELILWKVDSVGPLLKSGGLTELSRINSPSSSAFSNVAWIPTLLPSNSVNQCTLSPSALFVASDGNCLTVYQTVIDARALLLEQQLHRKHQSMSSSSSTSSLGEYGYTENSQVQHGLNIISLQSTSRPGCIIQLDNIQEACQDWQHTQLLHVFQEQLLTGIPTSHSTEAIVDLRSMEMFRETFYLVVLEKLGDSTSCIHMWEIVIASIEEDDNVTDDDSSSHNSSQDKVQYRSRININTNKLGSQVLVLPAKVEVVSATVAAGHPSSSSIYPACFAPYLVSTACSDGQIRFWRCQITDNVDGESNMSDSDSEDGLTFGDKPSQESEPIKSFKWIEWQMMSQTDTPSAIQISGRPISVCCAYSGRVAIAYRSGTVRRNEHNPDHKLVNCCVDIYECESTGGSEWTLEDSIALKNITIPDLKADIDLNCIYTTDHPHHHIMGIPSISSSENLQRLSSSASFSKMPRVTSIPSLSTIHSVKRSISEKSNKTGILLQKHLIQLDWVSCEDGSHILTVGVGSKILLYAPVSSEISQTSRIDNTAVMETIAKRAPILQRSKSVVVGSQMPDEIRWMKLRSIELTTADGLPPLPMHMSWTREGILVVGMDNEMHVFTQWKTMPDSNLDNIHYITDHVDGQIEQDSRDLPEQSLRASASVANMKKVNTFKSSMSVPSFKVIQNSQEAHLKKHDVLKKTTSTLSKTDSVSSLKEVYDLGLFEAGQLANPVLPQYHPKQLLELLNFGKIRRVKAILAHLVRCISQSETGAHGLQAEHNDSIEEPSFRPRTYSIATSPTGHETGQAPKLEEVQVDYIEISSIPPLPIFALYAADQDANTATINEPRSGGSTIHNVTGEEYDDLFSTSIEEHDEVDDLFDDTLHPGVVRSHHRERTSSVLKSVVNPNYFGPSQTKLLCKLLTHMHLPGLSSLDQMYLLALADTVANTKTEIVTSSDLATKEDSIDECGLRFLLAMRHHIYLERTMTPRQRLTLLKQGLSSSDVIWAFHSEAKEELLSMLPTMQKGEPTWPELKKYGVGWWVTNVSLLRRCIEKVAKAAFTADKQPLDAALYYLAMKKKTLVWGLFRSISDKRMMEFFKNDFTADRWRRAALKNAYALLGKQRFFHAAAFFLLAGSVRDAIEVCIHKLGDIQLGMVVARLYESDIEGQILPNLQRIFNEEILGLNSDGRTYTNKPHCDPFYRSMVHWSVKKHRKALSTLLDSANTDDNCEKKTGFGVFNFYNYLRTHALFVRQHIASTAHDKHKAVFLSGFTKTGETPSGDKNVTYIDTITPIERRLFFYTAHQHFRAGCPALALEVLSKLPTVVANDIIFDDMESIVSSASNNELIESGTISDKLKPLPSGTSLASNGSGFDWSVPVKQAATDDMDWGSSTMKFDTDELKLDLTLGDDSSSEENNGDAFNGLTETEIVEPGQTDTATDDGSSTNSVDIMVQQLKFISCLKIIMEELSTLATGFEVDGGQLRYQLYLWLEKEVDILVKVCGYGTSSSYDVDDSILVTDDQDIPERLERVRHESFSESKPSLHERYVAEKLDIEAKVLRMAKRKQWLKENQHLLRTLSQYCNLHGASGGGLASVKMELTLLLQELQQDKREHQLLASPLPFPTTLPLLSASVSSSKTVISDPIHHLQGLTQDILCAVIDFKNVPSLNPVPNQILLLRNLSLALSACIYQSLCDSDSFVVAGVDQVDVGMEGFTNTHVVYKDSYLMAGARKKRQLSGNKAQKERPTSHPSKWPGVMQLRALLHRTQDEDTPKLHILLCESLIGIYMSLLTYALDQYEVNILYRLVAHPFTENMWGTIFGGGIKKVYSTSYMTTINKLKPDRPGYSPADKQRLKFHNKVFGQTESKPAKTEQPTYKENEKFIAPEISMVSYFMMKPESDMSCITYDSEESVSSSDDDNDEDEDFLPRSRTCTSEEHTDPNSYSWCLMRYAIVRYTYYNIRNFLPSVGIELPELPVTSPLLSAILTTLELWLVQLKDKLDLYNGPPPDYIPGCHTDNTNGPSILKYKTMLDPANTPFMSSHHSVLPSKRLWLHLVHIECLQDVFIRYIFKKRRDEIDRSNREPVKTTEEAGESKHPVKIIYKDPEMVSSFCINQGNISLIALSTHKEVIEMDIGLILQCPSWLDDEMEYDIATLRTRSSAGSSGTEEDFVLVNNMPDTNNKVLSRSVSTPVTSLRNPHHDPHFEYHQTGNLGAKMLVRRPITGIRRMSAHPQLPYYLIGCQDGSVRMYEWGHNSPLSTPRPSGTSSKVTKLQFNAQGNKFGVSEYEGSVSLWQSGYGANISNPFMSLQCHNKQTSDFAFVGSSSLLATAGHSSESKNVALWDTLLPQRGALVQAFTCHEHGAPCVVFVPQHNVLISGGKKGDICIFDVRQRQLRQTFQAHDSAIKSIAVDPSEEFFVTGSADGDIKVWGLNVHDILYTFSGEHTNKKTLFQSSGTGVFSLAVTDSNHLYSCGADGTMKVRWLPEPDLIVETL